MVKAERGRGGGGCGGGGGGAGAARALPSRSGATLAAPDISANIKVAVRVRPPNTKEQAVGRRAVEVVDSKMLVFDPKEDVQPFFYQGVQQQTRNFLKRANKELKFMFDSVFDCEASNEDVFKATTKDILSALMDGFNCSVFVYGATGAGKTFTMIGSKEYPGITYLTMDQLFVTIGSYASEREFDICVSYLEVYNEMVFDLLKASPSKMALQLREDSKFGVMVAGLTLNSIKTARELLDMLEHGNKNRTQHPTDANAESSRSHAVFQVYVKMRYKTSGEVRIVKLSMIDLAGSERASATGCVGERFKEGANINRSLLSLGNCINKLADGCKYIPYRDSKLTRLLKDSLGGNCQTIMIANVSPSSLSYEDTYNTLKYAARANKIQMSIKKNIVDCDMHMSQYVKIVEELKKQVKELKAKLALSSVQVMSEVKKEAEPPVDKTKMVKWRHRLEEEYNTCGLLETRLLSVMSRQRVLALRQKLKIRALSHVAGLAHDGQDGHMSQVNLEEIPRQERTVDSFARQISTIQSKIHSLWKKWDETKTKMSKLFTEALSECPKLVDFVDKLKLSSELRFIKARDNHRMKVMQIQQEEINTSACYLSDMPSMLKKLYLILKGYGKVTPAMTEEYFDVLKKAKNSKAVSWQDEENMDVDDPQFRFVANLELDKPPELPFLLVKEEMRKVEIISDSDNLTDLENEHPVRKRKATPNGKVIKANDTIIIEDSFSDLNCTKVLSPSPAKKAIKSLKKLSDLILNKQDIENFSKELNPDYLNSTFVLAGKLEDTKTKSNDVKKGLSDRTNMQRGVNLPEKAKVVKPVVGNKTLPFRRPGAIPANATPSTGRPASAFGSTVPSRPLSAAQRNVQATPANRQALNSAQKSVGYKSVRARDRALNHPYTRPIAAKR